MFSITDGNNILLKNMYFKSINIAYNVKHEFCCLKRSFMALFFCYFHKFEETTLYFLLVGNFAIIMFMEEVRL